MQQIGIGKWKLDTTLERAHGIDQMGKRMSVLLGAVVILTVVILLADPGFKAIWPSVAALLLVFGTRNVLLGLLGGAIIGTALLVDGRIWAIPTTLIDAHLLPNFQSPWKSGAIVFTLLLGGFVHLLEKGGTLQSLLVRLMHGNSPRKVETGAGLFGLICFFDGLANSLMVGRLFKPLAERSGVSKVRLAYIVDTTSAAVACLAFISTWIAYQLAMIREGFTLAGQEALAQPYQLFFSSLPHNYYAWFALILLAFSIWRQWNFGPMGDFQEEADSGKSEVPSIELSTAGLWRAWVPVAVLMIVIFVGIYADGTQRMGADLFPFRFQKLALSFSEANVPVILIAASGLAAFLAWLWFPRENPLSEASAGSVFMEGMISLFQPVLILVMAWMLSSTLKELNAADYLGQLLGGKLHPSIFPLAVFLTGSLVAFTTGTSWGTMGLLMPLAIPLAFSLSGSDPAVAMNIIPVVIGAVFSGAVFGDHCSPISDTTIVSSIACGIDPMDHVRTQLPYALLAAAGAAMIGFPLAGITGGSPLIAGASAIAFVILLLVLWSILARVSTKA